MTPQERKEHTEQYLREKGIIVNPTLPVLRSASEITLKDLDTVCKRAVAALLSTQIGISLGERKMDDVDFFAGLMEHFNVKDCLNQLELRFFDGTVSEQDIIDVVWEYECFWSLAWALGLIDDIADASSECDCIKAIKLVSECRDYETFRSRCRMRSPDEIMDMLDLYWRYHWAAVEERIDPSKSAGKLDEEVILERRRGLEWLICDTDDWHDLTIDT